MSTQQLPLLPSEGEHALTRHSPFCVTPSRRFLSISAGKDAARTPSAPLRPICGWSAEFFGDDMVLDKFTTTKLNRFMDWIETGRGVPCSRKSYARRVTTLKVFFKFLKNEKCPARRSRRPRCCSDPALRRCNRL